MKKITLIICVLFSFYLFSCENNTEKQLSKTEKGSEERVNDTDKQTPKTETSLEERVNKIEKQLSEIEKNSEEQINNTENQLPETETITEEQQNNIDKRLPIFIEEGTDIDWILVKGGPRGDYYISKTEVTFEQYDKFCDETGYDKPDDEGWGRGSRPVINVYVNDANKFCEWLSKKTGKKIRLPEEDEWKYAARGGKKSKGYTYSGSNNLDEVGWYDDNSGNKTHDVGTKEPNELGIYDMSGNVWEWCGQSGDIRGGSWNLDVNACEVFSSRFNFYTYSRGSNIGFRIFQNK